ncbi:Aspartate carbamoyltransferase catalytic subunit [Methanosarcinaceae archaeon Ag5]|uniref:Aspartate carbamoyltransferase n=1 Tax=Methanolapillus africanus TaxID=3028297 RepID=A0AAE4SDA5_9EURY|nr:Aspartate carbamoyltransferase catalytic subunit [Methanosarcinaceae archaeon Ag5]
MQPLHHIISTREYSREMLDEILEMAEKLEPIARGEQTTKIMDGKLLALLFFEPSTRTRMSFETAMLRLGGQIINMGSVEASSIAKGESLADTIRVVSRYADAVVLRHPREGAALMASEFSSSPIINGGDGAGHHPTQTLLDLYTIKRESKLDNLNIALAGDLKYGRTVHSLCYALSRYGAKINLVSPRELELPKRIVDDLKARDIKVHIAHSMEDVIDEVDVLYMTRIQKERFPDPAEFNRVSNSMRITEELIENCKPNLKIMHPLPRVNEISPAVDKTEHAAYFKQAFYGVPVRMAILCKVLGVDI